MIYSGGRPVVLTLDDYFPTNNDKSHPFVEVFGDKNSVRNIWPMLIEKAYAKMYGCYNLIVGGLVDRTLADLCNGIPSSIDLRDDEAK